MGGEGDLHRLVNVEPFRMVIHFSATKAERVMNPNASLKYLNLNV